MKLFSDTLPFYRANLHTHTTMTDGRKTPEECMRLYRDAGYDILAITDHRKVVEPENIPDGLLMIPGIEFDYLYPTEAIHIVGLGVTPGIAARWDRSAPAQDIVDAINEDGGRAILAHPAWSLNTPETIADFRGLVGTEVWNSVSTMPVNADRADSSYILDVTAASKGTILPLFGNDDAHFYNNDFAGGWNMIQAESLTVPAVLDALDKGRFYATQGPKFRQIEFTDGKLIVDCDPVDMITIVSNEIGGGLRCYTDKGLTHAEYTAHPAEWFLRVELMDENGKKAWSSPIRVKD